MSLCAFHAHLMPVCFCVGVCVGGCAWVGRDFCFVWHRRSGCRVRSFRGDYLLRRGFYGFPIFKITRELRERGVFSPRRLCSFHSRAGAVGGTRERARKIESNFSRPEIQLQSVRSYSCAKITLFIAGFHNPRKNDPCSPSLILCYLESFYVFFFLSFRSNLIMPFGVVLDFINVGRLYCKNQTQSLIRYQVLPRF